MRSPEPGPIAPSKKHLTIGIFASFVALCSKHVKRATKKLKTVPGEIAANSPRFHPKSPKKLLTNISNKATTLVHRNRSKKKGSGGGDAARSGKDEFEEFGDGGVWQRAILMGDRCEPLDFSGVIYYDHNGKLLDEAPPGRSPRASPAPGYLTRKEGPTVADSHF